MKNVDLQYRYFIIAKINKRKTFSRIIIFKNLLITILNLFFPNYNIVHNHQM